MKNVKIWQSYRSYQQLVAESEEQADAIRDPHASTTLNIIASPG
jgi:hypothetical protein